MERGADPLVGRVLDGRYRVTRRVARGGMATVYEAHDLRLNRDCAVKVMHNGLGDDQTFAARFVREAHSAARLSHPNVVSVTDQGDDHGLLFIVMEYVCGRTLRDVMREQAPMPPARALALLEPVLLALAEAHRCGLVHRDVKPENVLIADDGRIKVADFGLARAFDADSTHTATGGVLMGTVSYLAPEVIVTGKADPRSDVYAVGVLLAEMLTGRKPHEGESAIQIAFKHVNEDVPSPSERLPDAARIPAYVDALVLRATAREREHRPADAKVLLHQVRRVRAAVEACVGDDPELTADLLPRVPSVAADSIDYVEDYTGAVDADREHTTVIRSRSEELPDQVSRSEPLVGVAAGRVQGTTSAGAPAPHAPWGQAPRTPAEPARVQPAGPLPPKGTPPGDSAPGDAPRPTGATAHPRPAPRRRASRGPLLLVLVLLLTALASYGGWWFGIGRYTASPGVINLSVGAAEAKLETAGLELDVTAREFSETVPAGSVIRTRPEAGSRLVQGATVEVVVSRGQERYTVPQLGGRRLSEIEDLLAENSLTLRTVTRVWSETVPRGVVVRATPSVGTELPRASVVDVKVSKGREPIDVPDLTGRRAERAEQRLTRLGFEVDLSEENSATVPEGRVIGQDPSKGTGFRGDPVELVVSLGPVMVQVPDLRTKSVDEATAELEELGLEIAVRRTDLYIGLDTVVRQDTATDSSVPEGSTVTVSVV
ncbi:MAG: Probable serine/threonine-protein kinase pknL [uncultured Nocardioidaceae bacterium]|uniref:non-specific serine/threonine protein kinase n=1 Tax=uncultured Nocardioidaceae bacterium TaxID=253824 RepID=A0A6J4LTC0_9ACTN|nr:MAG: Probable serine/threonine-protein kinase pknL [uncultured Nocardioidaceae bacterium]